MARDRASCATPAGAHLLAARPRLGPALTPPAGCSATFSGGTGLVADRTLRRLRVGHREGFKFAIAKLSKKSQKACRQHIAIRVFGARAPTVSHASDPTIAAVRRCAGQCGLQAFRPGFRL
jgi:hypothetical protein